MCVCVREREKGREREGGREGVRERVGVTERYLGVLLFTCVNYSPLFVRANDGPVPAVCQKSKA